MSIEPTPLPVLARGWTVPDLPAGWCTLVKECVATLSGNSAELIEALRAWQRLAMVFGDSGAPELCAITSLAALGLVDAGEGPDEALDSVAAKLRSHANLALLDLGLAHGPPGAFPVARIGAAVHPEADAVGSWLREFLQPLCKLEEAAQLCLRLAAIRARLVDRPEPFTLEAVRSLPLARSGSPPPRDASPAR